MSLSKPIINWILSRITSPRRQTTRRITSGRLIKNAKFEPIEVEHSDIWLIVPTTRVRILVGRRRTAQKNTNHARMSDGFCRECKFTNNVRPFVLMASHSRLNREWAFEEVKRFRFRCCLGEPFFYFIMRATQMAANKSGCGDKCSKLVGCLRLPLNLFSLRQSIMWYKANGIVSRWHLSRWGCFTWLYLDLQNERFWNNFISFEKENKTRVLGTLKIIII